MTLHRTVDTVQRAALGTAIGVGVIILLVILFRIGAFFLNLVAPPTVQPTNHAYGTLPSIVFPSNAVPQSSLTYSVNTLTGQFPEFPDRVAVFPIQTPEPNLLNLDRVKQMTAAAGITQDFGKPVPEKFLSGANYEWDEPGGFQRQLAVNIVSFDFSMTSNYLTNPSVLKAQFLSDENAAIQTAKDFLDKLQLFPADLDLTKSQNPDPSLHYLSVPQPYAIDNGNIVPTSSLSKAQLIRVDLYQNNLNYQLTTARPGDPHAIQNSNFSLPVLYSHPPYSTMTFWVGSGDNQPAVVAANFTHQNIASSSALATYPIKTVQEAFTDLKNGNSYVATYTGSSTTIAIVNVFLGYFMTDEPQPYLMPVYVFEGGNGFFAYVSAVQESWIKNAPTPGPGQVITQ